MHVKVLLVFVVLEEFGGDFGDAIAHGDTDDGEDIAGACGVALGLVFVVVGDAEVLVGLLAGEGEAVGFAVVVFGVVDDEVVARGGAGEVAVGDGGAEDFFFEALLGEGVEDGLCFFVEELLVLGFGA